MRKDTQPTSARPRVLIVLWPDYHAEIYADRPVDVRVCSVPQSGSTQGEIMAEEIALSLLPERWRQLYRADWLRAVGSARPVHANTLRAMLATQRAMRVLSRLAAAAEENAA